MNTQHTPGNKDSLYWILAGFIVGVCSLGLSLIVMQILMEALK